VQLVIQAAVLGHDGEALVLDMGEPVRIDAMARQLIELSNRQIEIEYTGLREGEKLSEELFSKGEDAIRSDHPLVSHVSVPATTGAGLLCTNSPAQAAEVTSALRERCLQMADTAKEMSRHDELLTG